jgi:hypothetical protein
MCNHTLVSPQRCLSHPPYHELTLAHPVGKRFLCHGCGKAFARADLMKRHVANHENDNDPASKRRKMDAGPGAARVSHACKACASARVKCEETKPCSRCRSRNLTCEYVASEVGSAASMHALHANQPHATEIVQVAQDDTLSAASSAPTRLESCQFHIPYVPASTGTKKGRPQ